MTFTTQCGHTDCGRVFQADTQAKASFALSVHIRRTHKVESTYKAQCPDCEKICGSSKSQEEADSQLRIHRAHKHSVGVLVRRVFWTDDEVMRVVAAWEPLKAVAQYRDKSAAFEKAQIQAGIPENRRKTLRALNTKEWAARIEKLPKLTPAPTQAPAPPTQHTVETVAIEVPVERPLEQTLKALSTSILLAELFTRVLTRLDGLEHALVSAAHSHAHNGNGNGNGHKEAPVLIKPPPRPSLSNVPTPAKRVPKIAIVGLLKDQYGHVRQKLEAQDCELVFIDKDRSSTAIPNVDALVVERHVQHRWTENGKAALGASRVFWAEGVTTVVQRCYDFLAREKQRQQQVHLAQ